MGAILNVLDCTLRDGGQGLENLNANGIKTEIFTDKDKIKIAELVRDSGIDIIEIGCMSKTCIGLEIHHFRSYSQSYLQNRVHMLPSHWRHIQVFLVPRLYISLYMCYRNGTRCGKPADRGAGRLS